MRYPILALLATGPTHGYEIKQAIDALFRGIGASINVGQIYTTLQRLERDGLVASREVEQESRPNKTVDEVTGAGLEELTTWLRTTVPQPRANDDLFMKVIMAYVTGIEDTRSVLARQRAEYLHTLRDLDELVNGKQAEDGEASRLLVHGAMLHLEADLKWLDLCEQRLLGGS
jgi:DNA-binding PadR family transcriptional regulator